MAVLAVALIALLTGGVMTTLAPPAAPAANIARPALAAPQEWAAALNPPRLSADAAVLVDFTTGQILYDKQARVPLPPASTTKVLTALVVLQHARLDEKVKVSALAAGTPCSCMGLVAGQTYTVEQLLWGLLLKSGNDAANALAEHVGGSITGFARMMNATAKKLGAEHSNFANPSGLPARGHVTTAVDLARITRTALDNPVIARMVATPEYALEQLPGRPTPLRLSNTNRLLRYFAGADGVKTGTTSAAGPCLISSATRDGHRLVAVVLKARGRWDDSTRLLQWGYDRFDLVRLARKGDVVTMAKVWGGLEPSVPLVATRDVAVLVPAGKLPSGGYRVELAGGYITAPVKRGQVVGGLRYNLAGQPKGEVLSAADSDLAALDAVPRANLFTHIVRWGGPLLRWGARRGLLGP